MTAAAAGPGRGAREAGGRCRQRCGARDWVIGLDIGKFSDSVRWDLMVKAVQANVTGEQRGIVLCLRRRLAAPIVLPDGAVQARDKGGTPQGSCVSPVPANLVMHYACGTWPERAVPAVESERYADDAAVHCGCSHYSRTSAAAAALHPPPEYAKRGLGTSNCSGMGRQARRHLYQPRNPAPPSLWKPPCKRAEGVSPVPPCTARKRCGTGP